MPRDPPIALALMVDLVAAQASWTEAVAVGATGAVARARSLLDRLDAALGPCGDPTARALLSLSASTRGSWLRQSNRHRAALRFDGEAARLVAEGFGRTPPRGLPRAAFADALIGLAADELGLGRFDDSSRLLRRVRTALDADGGEPGERPWLTDGRVELRWRWVMAENALYRGDAESGSRWARAAGDLGREAPTAHHRLKTRLIAAAAAAATGDRTLAADEAAAVAREAASNRLVPLEWAAAQLAAGVDSCDWAPRRIVETSAALRESGFAEAADFGTVGDGG